MDATSASPLQAPAPRLVLASGSAARAALLASAGLSFERVSPVVDEAAARAALHADGVGPADAATALAELKARAVARRHGAGSIVVGADQLLEIDGVWLEKPEHVEAARQQLRRLSGRAHRLISAVVALREDARVWHATDQAEIALRPLSDRFLDAYLARFGESLLGSVGAYRIEAEGVLLMQRVRGDHSTIQGLPLLPLLAFLREQGVLLG